MLVLAACSGGGAPSDPTTSTLPDPLVVSFTTDDGLLLEADWYGAGAGADGVLLLHMSPSNGYDRTVWPRSFIDALRARGFGVLAVDRRGAGASEGDPADAPGEPGVLDARASVQFMTGEGTGALVIVGASNGTTTTLDYTVTAEAEGYPVPAALVFMSGGSYTENQYSMEELDAERLLFVYPESEARWNEEQMGLDPGGWEFVEYPGDTHAAPILEEDPTIAALIVAWI